MNLFGHSSKLKQKALEASEDTYSKANQKLKQLEIARDSVRNELSRAMKQIIEEKDRSHGTG